MTEETDPRRRFSSTADRYRRWRPSYPPALIDWIAATAALAPGAAVADIGCGTGISARLFAERGYQVSGVEPNPEMLARAEPAKGVRYLSGEAAATGLSAASFDLASAAQAFHWFAIPETLREFARILKPGGRCAAFWNIRTGAGMMREYEELLRRFNPDYSALPKPEETIAALRAAEGVADAVESEFPNSQTLDLEGFLGRVQSSSYVALGIPDGGSFERELLRLFAAHQKDGTIEFQYTARALCWRLDPKRI